MLNGVKVDKIIGKISIDLKNYYLYTLENKLKLNTEYLFSNEFTTSTRDNVLAVSIH